MSADESAPVVAGDALAPVVVDLVRDLALARAEVQGLRELQSARLDHLNWLQAELCRARRWSILDLVSAWHAELDRRNAARQRIAA